ncbi:MAG TPA: N-acetylmuramoyl-L-alanine amidase [Leptospiraceae bacterium]|nr:N-acetylmuramoyl-L-alanine amidase [Leptospiraceae bacterium]HMY65121.1 N-acetylmuramoyl-L-alanine amidase [Leptospiraceae bacterium]HMZ58888.1 N-acetylmuramoyl-L-alanine amidase [Leptospiraceae bacterium]HNF13557.1 N-acetylmuramoyl-L-alanine amidase [Leptospiraceae bacterium]HNF25427.1 N-acetylmuramoyl-L-alanine amidase [Leptospiraceae bacterium]
MAKIKVFFWTLIISLSFSVSSEEEIPLLKGSYVDFDDLKAKTSGLSVSMKGPTMNGEIRGNNGESILFQVNSSYYNYRGMVEKASKPVKYIHEKIFIPLEIAESALKNLLENEVSYRQSRGKLLVNLYGNFKIEPEIIDLDMIIIDPGHGGKAPGAMSILGDPEKNYTLKMSRILGKLLKEKYPAVKIKYTRLKDEDVSLEDRFKFANENLKETQNIVYISLHCNSVEVRNESPKGYEIYYLEQKGKTPENREKTIITQNLIDVKRPPVVQKIQSDMKATLIQRRSILLANSLDEKMYESIGSKILSRGVKKMNLQVLRGSLMPGVLVELGFLTHPEEARLLADETVQLKIAKGIAEGIKLYVHKRKTND